MLFAFVTTYYLSREMNSDGYGELAILMSFHSLMIIFPKSLNPGLLRLLNSKAVNAKSYIFAEQLRLYSAVVQLVFGLILMIPVFRYFTQSDIPFLFFSLIVIQSVGFNFEQYVLQHLQAIGEYKRYAIVNTLNRFVKLMGILFLLLLGEMSLIWVVIVQILAQYSALFYLPKRSSGLSYIDFHQLRSHHITKYSLRILVTEIILVLGLKGQYFFAFNKFSNSEIGNFALAENLILFVGLIPQSILTLYSPMIQKSESHEETKLLLRLTQFSIGYFIICAIGYFVAPVTIEFIFGNQYQQTIEVFKILIIGAFFTMSASSYFPFFHKWGQAKTILSIEGSTSVFFICVLLIFQFNTLEYISYAYMGSRIFNYILCNVYYFKRRL